MPSLHDFEHLLIWFQAILFAFPTYLGAKAFLGWERQIYLTLTVVVTIFCILFGALARHASDEELAQETSARATLQARVEELQETVGRLSGNGAFPVILAGLTTQESAARLIMRNYTKAPLMGVKVEYTCMPSPISLSESVGTVPPNSVVDLATLLPLNTCRAFAVTSPTTHHRWRPGISGSQLRAANLANPCYSGVVRVVQCGIGPRRWTNSQELV